jgi:single-stranded DNA-binding protein
MARSMGQRGERNDAGKCSVQRVWVRVGAAPATLVMGTRKGRLVAVEGRLQTRNYETPDGSRRTLTEVIGDRAWFLDSRRAEGDGEGQPAGAEAQESQPELIGDPEEAALETVADS